MTEIKLTRRRVIVAVLTIGLAAAAAGAGTFALFSDSESVNNSVQAGTLDLTTNGDDTAATAVSVNAIKPGDTGSASVELTNAGTIDGYLDLNVTNVVNSGGDLQSKLDVTLYLSNDANLGTTANQQEIVTGKVGSLTGTTYEGNALAAGSNTYLIVEYTLPSSVGNSVQGETVTFDVGVQLDQQSSQ